MKKLLILLSILGACQVGEALAAFGDDRIIVVTHVSNKNLTLSQEQIRNLFMGASIGRSLKPVVLPPSNRTRSLFNAKIVGLSESRVQSYWAQMKFTGRLSPPEEVSSEKDMISYLLSQPKSIGYLTADSELPEDLIIIYKTE